MYELHNLSALKCFIEDTLEPGEAYMCTLNGDFLSPSLLSSLDLGAAAVAAMNAIPVTHACLGNHEFDHSIETLGQRLAELDCDVINTNVFACPLGEESGSAAAAAAAPPPRSAFRTPRRRTSNRSRTTAIPARARSSTTSPAPPRSRWVASPSDCWDCAPRPRRSRPRGDRGAWCLRSAFRWRDAPRGRFSRRWTRWWR